MKNKQIVFLGKTGSGKSSLINTLFKSNFPTDNAVSCTKKIQSIKYMGVEIFDTPGIAEELLADDVYFNLYKATIKKNSTIVWVFQADTRVYKIDQMAFLRIKENKIEFKRLFIALNHIDLIGNDRWGKENNSPTDFQHQLIKEKINDIFEKIKKVTKIEKNNIVPVSAKYQYNTIKLKSLIL